MDFDYATVRATSAALFGADVDIGKGITDLLINELVNGGAFSVIERKAFDAILKEQNISISDRFDSATAAQIGRLSGLDAIVIGSITQLNHDERTTNIGGGRKPGRFVRMDSKAAVAITARIVNVDTSDILTAVTGNGDVERSETLLIGADRSSGGNIDMKSSNFNETIIGETVNKAVNSVASQLQANSSKVTARVKIDGLVARVNGSELTVNVGSDNRVKIGDILTVGRVIDEVKDPITGEVIDVIEETLGELKITRVTAKSSTGSYSGSSPVEIKDRVHN